MNPNGLEYADGIINITIYIIQSTECYRQYYGTKENFRLRSTKIILSRYTSNLYALTNNISSNA